MISVGPDEITLLLIYMAHIHEDHAHMILSDFFTLNPQIIATKKTKKASFIYKISSCLGPGSLLLQLISFVWKIPSNENIAGTLDYENRGY